MWRAAVERNVDSAGALRIAARSVGGVSRSLAERSTQQPRPPASKTGRTAREVETSSISRSSERSMPEAA